MIPLIAVNAALKAKSFLGAIGQKIPLLWVVYAGLASAGCFLAAWKIDELFTVGRWALFAAGAVAGLLVAQQAFSVYYTGKLDALGDGKKPKAKG